ncbi:MAG: hypothetical protein H6733_06010 [Alphaproteobacteria bacterium]|nr:hypothetical protein [Alphaproteobacteria bacterium]
MLALLALLTLGTPAAHADTPAMEAHERGGVHVVTPEGWKVLIDPEIHNITASAGITTTITMYWYDWQPGITLDEMLDILVKTVNQTLPIGEAHELDRGTVPGMDTPWAPIRGKRMNAEVVALGYTMKLGLVTIIEEDARRVSAAFLVAPPEEFGKLDGLDLLTDVVRSLALDTDPPLPWPAWWSRLETPPALAAEATAP